jgi:membrane protein implicated in regulation of membrane protease activity
MAAYAALALAVMAALIAYSVVLWRRRLAPLVAPYLPPPWDLGPPAAVGVLVVAVVVVRVRRRRRARETEEVAS